MGQLMETPEKKTRGRPKKKRGKRVGFYLSFETIRRIRIMTEIGRNNSLLIETLVNKEFDKSYGTA